MPTINQLVNRPRKPKKKRTRNLALAYGWNSLHKSFFLSNSPQKWGFCKKVSKAKPRKPNSALRSIARVELSNKKEITAYIPGEGHNLQETSKVLIQGGKIQDLAGARFVIIRGTRDTEGVKDRKQGRSLYGKKKDKSPKN